MCASLVFFVAARTHWPRIMYDISSSMEHSNSFRLARSGRVSRQLQKIRLGIHISPFVLHCRVQLHLSLYIYIYMFLSMNNNMCIYNYIQDSNVGIVVNINIYIYIYTYIYPSRWFRNWVITLNTCSMNAHPNDLHRKVPPRVFSLIHKLGPYIGLISAPPLPHMAKSALILYLSRFSLYGVIFLPPSGLTHGSWSGAMTGPIRCP